MFIKLYDRGKNRIEGELDIVKIIKSIRNMKILMKNSFMNEEVIHQIYHSKKNLINIDESFSSKGETEAEEHEHGHGDEGLCCSIVKDKDHVKNLNSPTKAIRSSRKSKKTHKKRLHFHFERHFIP